MDVHSTASEGRKVFRVAEITRRIKAVLEDEVGSVWIEGEVSNARKAPSGHVYFTLKDEAAQIAAVFFRGSQLAVRTEIRDGAKVRVQGDITVYEQRGQYQVVVRRVEDAGLGDLQAAFEKLKARLAAEGLFDAARKKALPLLPQHIGLVTSPTGAAVRDMLNVLGRRFPNLHLVLAPVRVQGAEAAAEIAAAVDLFNERGDMDVLIVGRGGGSLEDLWPFNEEVVARAIARSRIPVISAVGHEIDFTICDFVADLRAPTPSAAAELVIRSKAEFQETLDTLRRHLANALRARLLEYRNRFTRAGRSYVFREPAHLLQRHRQQAAALADRMRSELQAAFADRQQRLDEAGLRMTHRVALASQGARERTRRLAAQLAALSPKAVLERGYSVTCRPDGRVVRDARGVRPGDVLVTTLRRGQVRSTVQRLNRSDEHG